MQHDNGFNPRSPEGERYTVLIVEEIESFVGSRQGNQSMIHLGRSRRISSEIVIRLSG